MRGHIRPLPSSAIEKAELHYQAVTKLNEMGTLNRRTQKLFDLSREDRWVIACSAAHDFEISSGDRDLCDFAVQEFDIPIVSPLEVVNTWIQKKLVQWNDDMQTHLKAWAIQNEHPQPEKAKRRFRELTGHVYVGC
jgi:hypothetical protein